MIPLEPLFVLTFTTNTYSCIKGRGIHAASKAVKKALKDVPGTQYCLKLDVRKFYPSVDHQILKYLLRRKIKDQDLLWLLDEIIDSAPGVPIGNYLSQYFANFYLTYFDHWVKEVLKVRYYFGYADDMVILSGDKSLLHDWLLKISNYLQNELSLTLKQNYQIFPVAARGIDVVGYKHYHTHTLLRKSIKKSFARMMTFSELGVKSKNLTGDKITIEEILDKPIKVFDYRVAESKYSRNNYLMIEIEFEGQKRVIISGSNVLLEDIEKIPKDGFPFCAALVAPDCGTGKSHMAIETCRLLIEEFGGRALIITELGASETFINPDPAVGEGARLGINLEYVTSTASALKSDCLITVTNYERVRDGRFDFSQFTVVWLDEGNYIKNMASETTESLGKELKKVKFKYIASATPSPNEILELINYAHVLGIADRGQILTQFFQRNSTKAGELTLHPQHEADFWLWAHSWMVAIEFPSDLGFSDEGYQLPKLNIYWIEVKLNAPIDAGVEKNGQARLVADTAGNDLPTNAKLKRKSIDVRLAKGMKEDLREKAVVDFTKGDIQYLGTKPEISGVGCNFQRHCHKAVVLGVNNDFNLLYQLIKQEYAIVKNIKRKWSQHDEQRLWLRSIVKKHGLDHAGMIEERKRTFKIERKEFKGKNYTLVNTDAVYEWFNGVSLRFTHLVCDRMEKHGFETMGFHYIPTCVVGENNQTYRLTFGEMQKDSTKMGSGIPEEIWIFRKPPTFTDNAYADDPVKHNCECPFCHRHNVIEKYLRVGGILLQCPDKACLPHWQIDADAFWQTSGNGYITPQEMSQWGLDRIADPFGGLGTTAGGTTTGFAMAKREENAIAKVIACVNHDWKAIKSHWQNHPEVEHYTEDIRTLDLKPLVELTLAEHLDRYILALDPDYVQIENVVEFMSWGPLDDNGKPVSRKSGSDWMRWRNHIDSFGYRNEWKELNSADFGAYTSRNRLFGCFAKTGLPIVWPQATHGKKPATGNMFAANVHKWKAVKDVLDFADEGESIFSRKKELVDASLERIEAGIIKFVGDGNDAFILKYNSRDKNGNYNPPGVDEPCPTVAVQNRLGMCFLAKYYSDKPAGKVIPVTGPAGTIKTSDGQSLITCNPFIMNTNFKNIGSSVEEPSKTLLASRHHSYLVRHEFIVQRNSGNPKGRIVSIDDPARTLTGTAQDLVKPCFLTKYHGNCENILSVNSTASTLSTKDRLALVQPIWLDKTYTGYKNIASIDGPAGTLMPCDKHRLISCEGFILNPSHGGHCSSLNNPGVTIVARQDKAPLYFIQFKFDVNVTIPVYNTDSPVMVRIKNLMAYYGISDIKMRMLKVLELLKIQGFPSDYQLYGNQSDQKKFIEAVGGACCCMITYTEICEENKALFAQLEQYTREISYCKLKGLIDDAELLSNQKEGIRHLINLNMERMETYWKSFRSLENVQKVRNETYRIATKKEKKIIDLFTENPDNSMKTIAAMALTSIYTASRVITKHLDQIIYFWRVYDAHSLGQAEIALYFHLLDICNNCSWTNPFKRQNTKICAHLGMSKKTLEKTRNRLQQVDLIKISGTGKVDLGEFNNKTKEDIVKHFSNWLPIYLRVLTDQEKASKNEGATSSLQAVTPIPVDSSYVAALTGIKIKDATDLQLKATVSACVEKAWFDLGLKPLDEDDYTRIKLNIVAEYRSCWGSMTLNEIVNAFAQWSRGKYGKVYGLTVAVAGKLMSDYLTDQSRADAVKSLNPVDPPAPPPKPEDQFKLLKNCVWLAFDKYKSKSAMDEKWEFMAKGLEIVIKETQQTIMTISDESRLNTLKRQLSLLIAANRPDTPLKDEDCILMIPTIKVKVECDSDEQVDYVIDEMLALEGKVISAADFDEQKIINTLHKGDSIIHELLKKLFPDLFYEDPYLRACKKLGITPEPSLKNRDNKDLVSADAHYRLTICIRAKNVIDGKVWEPVYDGSETHYWPYFNLESGFGFSRTTCANWRTFTGVGSRLEYRTEELAQEGSTWNPTIGCSEQSPGCTNCYAVKMAYRLMHIEKMKGDYHGLAKRLPNGKIVWTGEVTALEKRLIEPLQINRPTTFFVNSMSDLFHPAVPFEFINKVFVIMALTPNHTYQILTKQPKRAVEYFKEFNDGLPGSRDIDEMVTDYREFMFDKNGQISAILRNAGWFYENRNSIDGNDGCISYVPNVPLKNVWIGKAAADNFKTYIESLKITPEVVNKISVFDLTNPLYSSGFHPAMALHMIQYNDKLKADGKANGN
eukprot:gene11467-11560_t